MKCLIGLGNFPSKYAKTRHNFGFLMVDVLAKMFGFSSFKEDKKFFAFLAEGEIDGQKVLLVKPTTYMNLSGKTVFALANFYKISSCDIWVFHDDIDLEFGVVRFREKGSAGGHNGVSSIIQFLGTEVFSRIKFGISNDQRVDIPTENFVLMNFTASEQKLIPLILQQGVEKFLQVFKNIKNKNIGDE